MHQKTAGHSKGVATDSCYWGCLLGIREQKMRGTVEDSWGLLATVGEVVEPRVMGYDAL